MDVQHNVIAGVIPSQLFDLPNLVEVNLSDNRLSGGLLNFVSGMLTLFDASGNLLNGTMPQDFGKSNTKLTHLDVGDNQLSGFIPSSLEGLTTLVHLSLSKNTLSGTLPTFVGERSRLKYLYLNENRLIGTISPTWGINGSQLTEVSLQDNMLSGSIPSSLSLLSNLIDFYVHGKEFRLLTIICFYLYLTLVCIATGNKLTGTIPSTICSPTINSNFVKSISKQLQSSNCGSISCPAGTIGIDGVAPCLPCNSTIIYNPYLGRKGTCRNQTEADIVGMLLARKPIDSTKIPVQLDSACQYQGVSCNQEGRVVRIDASGRGLTGTIPDELGFLQYLTSLNLSGNLLTGFLPSGLRFAPLRELDVSGNQLRGLVPPLLCNSIINGNAATVAESCSSIACPVGFFSDTGRGQCQPCDNGSVFLGSKSCISPTSASQTATNHLSMHIGSIVALVFVVIAVATGIVWARFILSRRLRRRKASPKDMARGQIIREFQGEANFPSVDELKGNEPPSNRPLPLVRLVLWFQRIKRRQVGNDYDDEERIDFRATMPPDEVDDRGWNERQQFVIDDEDDQSGQSELERIVMKQQMDGGTVVWEYPDPLERSVASWTVDDDSNAKSDFKRYSGYPDDHPTELWLDVPRI